MKRQTGFLWKMFGVVAWIAAAAGLCHAEQITHSVIGKTEQWHIDSPIVNSNAWRNYAGEIVILPGDQLYYSAGGCVQTGGHGLTWKRYVDPQGPNSDKLYRGFFSMPGVAVSSMQARMTQIAPGSDVWEGQSAVSSFDDNDLNTLWLAYSDDGYSDNGYYSHDNGTGDQCRNVGNAWFNLIIVHP